MLYKWNKASNNTYTIFDVEIFSQHDKILRDYEIIPDQIKKAIDEARTSEINGYLPPIHTYHHDFFLKPSEIEMIGNLQGLKAIFHDKHKFTVTANLIDIKESEFERIKNKEFKYRSIEAIFYKGNPDEDFIPDDIYEEDEGKEKEKENKIIEVNSIMSLALLSHEVPFFQYNLLILEEDPDQSQKGINIEDIIRKTKDVKEMKLAYLLNKDNNKKIKTYSKNGGLIKMDPKEQKVIKNAEDQQKPEDKKPEEKKDEEVKKNQEIDVSAKLDEISKKLDDLKALIEKPADKKEGEGEGSEEITMAKVIDNAFQKYLKIKDVIAADLPKSTKQEESKKDDYDFEHYKKFEQFKNKPKEEFIKFMEKNAHYIDSNYIWDEKLNKAVKAN